MEEQRYPMSVRLIGVMHKEKSKMYMTSVLWSDQNDIVVYRTFGDFLKMHKKLKKAFPASKFSKSDRVLPKFQAQKMKRQGKKQVPTKSLVRLKSLQKYCTELLKCDPRVAQSADLIQFFHPKDQDLQPDFSKNSVMIMPSEDDLPEQGGGNVTQPFVTETYRCVAPYETKDTKNKSLKVALDEKVDVLIKDKGGWWLVETDDKRMAWFPAPYLEKLEEDEDDEDERDGTSERGVLYCTVKSYKATKDDEISVPIGSVVEVLQRSDNGWWLIRYSGKAGYIPTMFLQPYNYPHIRMTTQQQDFRPSSPLQVPNLEQQSRQFSHSQGNLMLPPPVRSSSPQPLQADSRLKSRSLNLLSDQAPPKPARTPTTTPPAECMVTATPTTFRPPPPPPPAITVEMDEVDAQGGRSWREESEGSFSGDSSDFSFSDSLCSSSASSTLNLSPTGNDDRIRLSRTPPPPSSNHLSPTSANEGRLMPSISDPNLYKGPSSPKVPPRPQAQEILKRCTTITRKNAARGGASPTPPEILSR